ncbi:TPA: hypothetical protein GRR64_19215 [Vibrio parahaemolyticus]|nr:Ig-like domain-containing protein [Vibrio parahaemolyticus]HAS6479710.1 hypothetical protein [Vibrio parahaemolyticus]
MTQLFRDDEACNYFFEIMKVTKRENYIDDLVKMSKEAGESKVFGYALYDSGAFPQLSNLSRDFFAVNYTAILTAMISAGVFDSYILLVRQVLGESTLIFHEIPNPGHLSLNIVKTESDIKRLATSDETHLATSDELGILITVPVSDYTIMQLLKTIQALCQPAGIYVDLRTIYPSAIDISPIDFSLTLGKSVQYAATVTYDDGTTDDRVFWDSSDPSIASIDENGLAVAIKPGEVEISAHPIGIQSFKSSTTLHVRDVVSIDISPLTTTAVEGDTIYWVATVTYTDGTTKNTEDYPEIIIWLTSDPDIAIPTGGNAYFKKTGEVIITARSIENGEIETSLDIVVSERLPAIVTQPSSGETLQSEPYSTTAVFVDEYDLAWKWYFIDDSGEVELNSGTGANATLIATSSSIGEYKYICRATNSFGRTIETNQITVSVLENTEKFSIVVGTRLMPNSVIVGVSKHDEYGSFSSPTWPQLEADNEQQKWYLIVVHVAGSSYQTQISASSGAMWKGWSGITAKFTSDTSSITISIPYTGSGITGKYFNLATEAEGSPLYEFFTENMNKTLSVEFSEYTPTAEEIALAELAALFQFELDEQRK